MKNPFSKIHTKRVGAIVSLLLIAVLGYHTLGKNSKKNDFSDMANVIKVDYVQIQDMPVSIVTLAQLLAIDAANIASEVDGMIESIHFNEGQLVKQGDLLIKLNDATQTAQLEQAQAQEDLAQIDYDRLKNLYARGATPKQELDKAEADLKVAQANVSMAQAELNKTFIKAPFNGRLGVRNISVGGYVSAGDKLLDIVDRTRIKIQYAIPQQYLAQVELGAPVSFTTSAFPLEAFMGQVDFISPSIDMQTRTLLIEAVFDNANERLSPGLSGQITQVLYVIRHAMTIPEEALVPTIAGYTIYEVIDQHAYAKSVKIGSRREGYVHITEGVEGDDVIVTQGQQNLRDGAQVEILELDEEQS